MTKEEEKKKEEMPPLAEAEEPKARTPLESPAPESAGEPAEEMGMAELLAEHESASESLAGSGSSFTMAKVISFIDEGALVDVGGKAEALISKSEYGDHPPFAVGESIPVLVSNTIRRDGHPKVSWRAARDKMAWEHIDQAMKNKTPLTARVKGETRGGLVVECENGLLGFIPASQVDLRPSRDLKQWKDKTVTAYVVEYDIRKNNLVLSRRLWISEETEKKKKETLAVLKAGDVKKGTVTGITTFGAFVDIGGVEGLLHIGEVEWAHTKKVSDVLKMGQEIEVKVIKYDPEKEKISLSRKELLPHPWDKVEERFPVGAVLKGKVVSLTDFGAFVELAPQVEGLLHSSEISWQGNGQKPKDVLKVGQEVEVKVILVNRAKEKISLSLKRVGENPWDAVADKYPVGSHVKVTVSYLVPFGAFAKLPEGVEGLIHVSDFSWTKRIRHPEDAVKVGQELEAAVIEVNREKEKISFGLKQLKPNPFETYGKGKRVSGTVTQVSDAGALIEIEPEVEGFIPASEISNEKFVKPADLLGAGDRVEAKVILVDAKERKISCSIKQLERELQAAAVRKYSDKAPRPNLGKLLDI